MRLAIRPAVRALATATAVAATGAALAAVPAHATTGFPPAVWPVRTPNAVGVPDPGAIHVGSRWYVASTGSATTAGTIKTATDGAGPWTSTGKPLLTNKAAWMQGTSVWAPSIMRVRTGPYAGEYVAYFAGLVSGHKTARCIGVATGSSPAGNFKPTAHPISCWYGSGTGAPDAIKKEGTGADSMSLIDPTPAYVGGQDVLTYKTEHKLADGDWHTTIRMVKLDSAHPWVTAPNPVNSSGLSIKITDSVNKYIEENPVLVQHGSSYTLFTSWGWFGRCAYTTRYRQSTALWTGWLSKSPTLLSFPTGLRTCGDGNAQVTTGLASGSWRILFNGHIRKCEVTGADPGHGPKGLYVGVVAWSSAGRPSVTKILPPPAGATPPSTC